jgi:hypothetical protein
MVLRGGSLSRLNTVLSFPFSASLAGSGMQRTPFRYRKEERPPEKAKHASATQEEQRETAGGRRSECIQQTDGQSERPEQDQEHARDPHQARCLKERAGLCSGTVRVGLHCLLRTPEPPV